MEGATESKYIFRSERLGFRNWIPADLSSLIAINSDPIVMEYFPALPTSEETQAFIARMQDQYLKTGYCYFAVELLATSDFIGFIGLSNQSFEASFTPCVDIGWRLDRKYWNQGLATEGARRCLKYAFEALALQQVYAVAPKINLNSVAVMRKIGMHYLQTFPHPKLNDCPRLQACVLYLTEANG